MTSRRARVSRQQQEERTLRILSKTVGVFYPVHCDGSAVKTLQVAHTPATHIFTSTPFLLPLDMSGLAS
jgi:hypothetical protein